MNAVASAFRLKTAAIALGLIIPLSAPLTAQSGDTRTAAIAGTVRDSAGRPLGEVSVTAIARGSKTVTDSLGRFIIAALNPGHSELAFTRLGFAPETLRTVLVSDSTIITNVRMRAAQILPEVNVRADWYSPRLARDGFYDRQKTGWGHYLTPEVIAKMNVSYPSQLLRDVPFILLDCSMSARRRTGGCIVLNSRKQCVSLFVDGVHQRMHLDERVSSGMVYAVEVYHRSARVPMEFMRPAAERECGAVVVWTQSRKP